MVTILNRPVSSVDDKRLHLENSQWASRLTIGTSWTSLQLAFRFAIRPDFGSAMSSTPRLFFGLTSGAAGGMASSGWFNTVGHFVGAFSDDSNWEYQAGPPRRFNINAIRVGTKINGTTAGSSAGVNSFISAEPDTIRVALIVCFVKGSPNWSVFFVTSAGTAALVDLSSSAIKTAMLQTTGSNIAASLNASIGGSGTRYSNSALASPAIDEGTNGNLDSICLGWNREWNGPEISDVFFRKVA